MSIPILWVPGQHKPVIVLLQTEMEKRVKAAKEWAQYGARHEKQPT
jgi:hypothetical protein